MSFYHKPLRGMFGTSFVVLPFHFKGLWSHRECIFLCRNSLNLLCCLANKVSDSSLPAATCCTGSLACLMCMHERSYSVSRVLLEVPHVISSFEFTLVQRTNMFTSQSNFRKCIFSRYLSNKSVELKTESNFVRFSIGTPVYSNGSSQKARTMTKKAKMSRKAKLNELRFYRLKAKKKMNSPNPEVRIRYKLEKVDTFLFIWYFLSLLRLLVPFVLLFVPFKIFPSPQILREILLPLLFQIVLKGLCFPFPNLEFVLLSSNL